MILSVEEQRAVTAQEIGVVEATDDLDNTLSNFRLLPENAIPIPPTIGERFSQLFDDGVRMLEARHREWKTNIEMFLNEDAKDSRTPIENLVRTTIESLVDFTYMRNPHAEISSLVSEDKGMAKILQKVLTALMNKRTLPGINLRPKVLKQIIFAHLTNFGILELTWQDEKGSLEQVLEVNKRVKERIKQEQDPEKASPLYELLDILQRELDVRRHVGIGVRVRSPFSLLIDPNCQELDLSDCKWVMDRDIMKIDHIKAEYTIFDEEQERYFFKYNNAIELDLSASPAHTKEATETSIIDAIMPDVDSEQAKLRAKDTVPVVWVYDKTTRLKYLYIEGRWDVPLWVFPDEMELSRFFPFFILAFSAPLNSVVQAGEVSHYIGFQDEINRINAQISKVRIRSFNKYLYNSTVVDKEQAEKIFNFIDTEDAKVEAIGVKIRDQDRNLSDVLEPLKLPSTQFKEIFDKTDLKEALNRTTRTSDAMRGAQFRTNTTNQAIDAYNETATSRLEGLTDKIELAVESLLWSMCELIVSKMTSSQINQILTVEDATAFKPLSVAEFNRHHNLVIAAGSIEKPTSSSKKQEAVQIIQMLGQFGTAAPRTVLSLVARLLRSAFSRALVTDDDLQKLEEEGIAAMQKGVSTQQGGQPQPQTQGQRQ